MKIEKNKNFVSWLAFSFVFVSVVFAVDAGRFVESLRVADGELTIDFQVSELLDDKVLQGIKHGFRSEIIYNIVLWKKRSFIGQRLLEKKLSFKLYYDHWDEKFALISDTQNRLTPDVNTFRQHATVINDIKIVETSELDPETKYYIAIHASIQPLSDEAFHELKRWMGRDAEKQQKQNSRKKEHFFGTVLNLLGFGEKEIEFKSRDFMMINDTIQPVE